MFIDYIFVTNRKKQKDKLPLKYTARIKRLMVTNTILHLIPITIMLITFNETNLSTYYLVLGIFLILLGMLFTNLMKPSQENSLVPMIPCL